MKFWTGDTVINHVNNAINNGQTDHKSPLKKSDINQLQSRSITFADTKSINFTADFKHNVVDNSVNIFASDWLQDHKD